MNGYGYGGYVLHKSIRASLWGNLHNGSYLAEIKAAHLLSLKARSFDSAEAVAALAKINYRSF